MVISYPRIAMINHGYKLSMNNYGYKLSMNNYE